MTRATFRTVAMVDPRALKGGETSFGVFHPKDYVLAVSTDPAKGDRAAVPGREDRNRS